MKNVAKNKKAFYDYFIEEELEVGIVLKGSEIKSAITNGMSLRESHVGVDSNGEMYLYGSHIPKYSFSSQFNHEPNANRKLLAHKREIQKLSAKAKQKGYTLIPLEAYINDKGKMKIKVGLGKGKKLHDKREHIKQRDLAREERNG